MPIFLLVLAWVASSPLTALYSQSDPTKALARKLESGHEKSSKISENFIREIDLFGRYFLLGKVGCIEQETDSLLAAMKDHLTADFFFKKHSDAPHFVDTNTLYAQAHDGQLIFTERHPIGLISESTLEILPHQNGHEISSTHPARVYSLLNNRFAYVYHPKTNTEITNIDIYEKIPFIHKMHRTEFGKLTGKNRVATITPEGILLIAAEHEGCSQLMFKELPEGALYSLLAPFSKSISSHKEIAVQAVAFARKSALVAILFKADKNAMILIGHRALTQLPVLKIIVPTESTRCAWDADEKGIITDTNYYTYPFVLGILDMLKKRPSFTHAECITLEMPNK
jgi:hypothetical protein